MVSSGSTAWSEVRLQGIPSTATAQLGYRGNATSSLRGRVGADDLSSLKQLFCLQFPSFWPPCGNITHFVKQDNLGLNRQLPTCLMKAMALFVTNVSTYSIQPLMCEEMGAPHSL